MANKKTADYCGKHYERIRKYGEPIPKVTLICDFCGKAFTIERSSGVDKRRKYCSKECRKANEYSNRNIDKLNLNRLRSIAKRYNMTSAEYQQLRQGNCPICLNDLTLNAMDHNHDTGQRRDMLCRTCNSGIGFFQDNPILLLRAVKYLYAHDVNVQERFYTWEQALVLTFAKAVQSPDPSTQNGAILLFECDNDGGIPIIESLACNTFPADVNITEERLQRPVKYNFITHAEESAIYKAARYGLIPFAEVLVSPWAACARCAVAIIETGISKVITCRRDNDIRWNESIKIADAMFEEAGVELVFVDLPEYFPPIRRDGKMLIPERRVNG